MPDRGVSTALGYVLALAMTALLITGLLVAGGDFVRDSQKQVVRQELQVVGNHVASNIELADRLAVAGDDTHEVTITRSLPEQVTGASYGIELVAESDPYLRLNSTRPDVSVEIEVDNSTALGDSYADGGDVTVELDSGELVIRNG
jgi:hypothetical protein